MHCALCIVHCALCIGGNGGEGKISAICYCHHILTWLISENIERPSLNGDDIKCNREKHVNDKDNGN